MNLSLADFVFYGVALVTVAAACYAVFSRNIVRAVFALLGTFFGMAVLYAMLSADFVAVIQILVYVGGILVLLLFAVMLTSNIESAGKSNPSGGWLVGLLASAAVIVLLVPLMLQTPWPQSGSSEYEPTTESIGNALLSDTLLPFEIVSILLLGVVIGAVVIARYRRSGDMETKQ